LGIMRGIDDRGKEGEGKGNGRKRLSGVEYCGGGGRNAKSVSRHGPLSGKTQCLE
jgi:hypothetical protein